MARKFKPLTLGTLPRVFVNILALDSGDITAFYTAMVDCVEMQTWFKTTDFDVRRVHTDFSTTELWTRERLAVFFLAILNLSKITRTFFVKDFDRLLNDLGKQDFWGTEGQCDPRGDRRELSGY